MKPPFNYFTLAHSRTATVIQSTILPPRPPPPAQWCCENLIFNEPGNHGPFSTRGAEYIIEPLNLIANRAVNDVVLCWGSQTRKTGTLMGAVAYLLANEPCGVLWVMPSVHLAKRFSKQRWMPFLRGSPAIQQVIPRAKRRHDFSSSEQIFMNGAVVNFVGSNSPANLSSNPCRIVMLDEVDKFDEGGRGEADAVTLAIQRTKHQPDPQRWQTSTPTILEGLIWQAMMRGDLRRFYVPCPHCGKFIVLAWSREYTIFKLTGDEAFIRWDAEAHGADGEWDLERVRKSARAECPHCGGHIRDEHKPRMNAAGQWRPTQQFASSAFRSYHLPSLYSVATECNFGAMAVRFLELKKQLNPNALQGFINGDLAEPDASQAKAANFVISINNKISGELERIMTIDCQAKSPFFWWVVREWSVETGHSTAIACGSAETIEELDEIQKQYDVEDSRVAIDSGFGARTDVEVYRICAERGEPQNGGRPQYILGWIASKGIDGQKQWRDEETGAMLPVILTLVDPFMGMARSGEFAIGLMQFSSDKIKDIHAMLVERRLFAVSESVAANDDYNAHNRAEVRVVVVKKNRTRWGWMKRHHTIPDHLRDCEIMQVAFAMLLGLLDVGNDGTQTKNQT